MTTPQKQALTSVCLLLPLACLALLAGARTMSVPSFIAGFLFALLLAMIGVLAWMDLTGRRQPKPKEVRRG